ncbi:preprotein translocase subunit YajC [Bifidobacterium adolescentis]|uniref:preprotein translocase subunit YajC n=1 Tax=Bifidobacterium adolescentis TaxID=1680 RepID=UPI003CCC7240
MFGMMFWQSKKAKQQQAERQNFRSSLQSGTEVITIGGIIGKVVSVDTEYEEIVVDSEGSQLRFGFNAISREYVRPAYVHDDEVDENGNPLSKEDEPDQKPVVDATEEPAQDADVIQQPIDEQKND